MHPSLLTASQAQVARSARIDLSVGYPRLRTSAARLAALRRAISSGGNAWVWEEEIGRLNAEVATLLGLPVNTEFLVTFSGTTAIGRTLQALAARREGSVIVTSPGFDSIASLAQEATGAVPEVVRRTVFREDSWIARLLERIRESDPSVVLLVSPDNPSGRVLTKNELTTIATACGQARTTLVLDQCFAPITPYGSTVPLATSVDGLTDWCLLWDSSKTVELMGEKVGVILPSESVRTCVQDSLGILHLDLPLSSIVAVRRELKVMRTTDGIRSLSDVVATNASRLRAVAERVGLTVNEPDAGSFLLLGVQGTYYEGHADRLAARLLSKHGVALAHDRLLTLEGHMNGSRESYLRVLLASRLEDINSLCQGLETELLAANARTSPVDIQVTGER